MRLRVLLILATFSMAACGYLPGGATSGSTHIDYVNFVKWGGRTYLGSWQSGRALTESDLGAVQFKVQRDVSESNLGPGYQPVDGDAAYLRPGTPVYAVRGYSPTFRLAAYQEPGQLVLFELNDNPRAMAGRDLLDIGGKVREMRVLSKADERTILGRIDDPTRITTLVADVLTAPVDSRRQNRGELSAFVWFQLRDGTATTQPFFDAVPMLGGGILVPHDFSTAIDQVIASAPTPTPIPPTINLAQRYHLAGAVRVYIKRISPPPGVIQDPARVQQFVAALDVDLPTLTPTALPSYYTVVGFEWANHYVAFAYDPSTNTLTVVAPWDTLAVHPTQRFRDLVSQAVGS